MPEIQNDKKITMTIDRSMVGHPDEKERTCSKCLETFPATNEHFHKKDYRCRPCMNKAQREYRQSEKGRAALAKAQKKYNTSPKGRAARKHSAWKRLQIDMDMKRYEQKLKEQNERCAICTKSVAEMDRDLCVDHDHRTGQVRGLLCTYCNKHVLGAIRDNPIVLRGLRDYLNKHVK